MKISGLEPGSWEVWAPEWKDYAPSERENVEVMPQSSASITISVARIPLHEYASGTVELPSAVTFDEGQVKEFRLQVVGGTGVAPLYKPNEYYYVGLRKDLMVQLVDNRTGLAISAPFQVKVGEHGIHQHPELLGQ